VELYLKRFFWVIPIVVIFFCSLLAARAANHIIEGAVLVPLEKAKPKSARTKKPPKIPDEPTGPRFKDDGQVIARNVFCSTCDPAAAKPPDSATPAPTPTVGDGVPITSASIVLLGTLVASDPELSAATIVHTINLRSGSYRKGDVIPSVGKVLKVRPKYVDFENSSTGRVERVEMGAILPAVASAPPPPPTPPPPSPIANPTPPPSPDADLLAELEKGIRKVDDTHYDIDRALVEKMMNDTSQLSRAARIVPSIQGGKNNGFKLYAIRPNSPFAKLGLQNGDTVQVVNGFEVTGFDKALEVLSKVRSANNLSVQILRRGQPVTMEYSIK
jgi:general secretion pathway protein C